MTNFLEIRNIFFSGDYGYAYDVDTVQEITFFVNNGYLLFERVVIGKKQDYLVLLSKRITTKDSCDADGGSKQHIALKIIAGKFIKNTYEKDIFYEHVFCGYYPDVKSTDSSIIVECGLTNNPEKIFAYFKGGASEVIQVPYPYDEDTEIIGYKFTAAENFREFLEFYEKEKLSNVKRFLPKR